MSSETFVSAPNPYRTAGELLHRVAAREMPDQVLKRRRQYHPCASLKADSIMVAILLELGRPPKAISAR